MPRSHFPFLAVLLGFWNKGDEALVEWPEGNAFGCKRDPQPMGSTP
jgi:hypothetical protein